MDYPDIRKMTMEEVAPILIEGASGQTFARWDQWRDAVEKLLPQWEVELKGVRLRAIWQLSYSFDAVDTEFEHLMDAPISQIRAKAEELLLSHSQAYLRFSIHEATIDPFEAGDIGILYWSGIEMDDAGRPTDPEIARYFNDDWDHYEQYPMRLGGYIVRAPAIAPQERIREMKASDERPIDFDNSDPFNPSP